MDGEGFHGEAAEGVIGEFEEGMVSEVVGLEFGFSGDFASDFVGEFFEAFQLHLGGGDGQDAIEGSENPDTGTEVEVEFIHRTFDEGGMGGDGGSVATDEGDHLSSAEEAATLHEAETVILLIEVLDEEIFCELDVSTGFTESEHDMVGAFVGVDLDKLLIFFLVQEGFGLSHHLRDALLEAFSGHQAFADVARAFALLLRDEPANQAAEGFVIVGINLIGYVSKSQQL